MIYYKPYWLNDDELEHFGIKGMKWGIRRYQNPDGTLTEAGKQRYGTIEKFQEAKARTDHYKKVAKTAAIATGTVIGVSAAASVVGGAVIAAIGKRAMSKLLTDGTFTTMANDSLKLMDSIAKASDAPSMSQVNSFISETASMMDSMHSQYTQQLAEGSAFSAQVLSDMARMQADFEAARKRVSG